MTASITVGIAQFRRTRCPSFCTPQPSVRAAVSPIQGLLQNLGALAPSCPNTGLSYIPLSKVMEDAFKCLHPTAIECRLQRADDGTFELSPEFRVATDSGEHDCLAPLEPWYEQDTATPHRLFAQLGAMLSAAYDFLLHLMNWQALFSGEVADALFGMAQASATARGSIDRAELDEAVEALAESVVRLPDDWRTDHFYPLPDAQACALRAHLSELTDASRHAIAEGLLSRVEREAATS